MLPFNRLRPVLALRALVGGVALLAGAVMLPAADFPLPVSLGAPIVQEDFSRADATNQWRWGAGRWTVANGVLKGTETPERKHAAGIACQRRYQDAAIRFRFQFAGGRDAILLLRNQFGNLCRVVISPAGMTLTKDKPNLPKNNPDKAVVLGKAPLQLKAGTWYTVSAVVVGEEFAVTLHDHATLKSRHPAINVGKTEIEFLASGDSVLFDDLQAWTVTGRK